MTNEKAPPPKRSHKRKGGNSAARDRRTAETRQRERTCLELRKAGMSYDAIAQKVGLADRSVARHIVQRALAEIPAEAAEELRQILQLQLEDATRAIWQQVLLGDLDTIRTLLGIHQRQASLLGLDAPKAKQVFTIETGEATPAMAAAAMREEFGGVTPSHETQGDQSPRGAEPPGGDSGA